MSRFQYFNICSVFVVAVIGHIAATNAATKPSDFKVQIVADDMCCKGCAQKVAAGR